MAMLVKPKKVGGVDDTGKGAKFSSKSYGVVRGVVPKRTPICIISSGY